MPYDMVLFLCFMFTIFIFGSIFNLILLVVYSKFREKYPSIKLLFSIALLNFLTSLIAIPIIALNKLYNFTNDSLVCKAYKFMNYDFGSLSLLLLLLIGFERLRLMCITVKIRFLLFDIYNAKVFLIIVLVLSILYSLVAFLVYDNDHKTKECVNGYDVFLYISGGALLIIFILLCIIYLKIYLIVTNVSRRVTNFKTRESPLLRKNFKIAKRFFLISIIYIVTWLPWLIIELRKLQKLYLLHNLYYLNCLIDPIIYAFLSRYFRDDMFSLLQALLKKRTG